MPRYDHHDASYSYSYDAKYAEYDDASPPTLRRRRALNSPARRWLRFALPLLPLICVALGGGTARWGQGVTLLLLGAFLLVAPPRASAGKWLNGIMAGLLLLAGTAFLPAQWFRQPGWRAALLDDFGLVLPPTLSPQPWLSAESLLLFLAGLSWFYVAWTLAWSSEEKLRAGQLYARGVVLLGGGMALLYQLGAVVPGWVNERNFGPFPNRNQTANFLAVGALMALACAHARWRAGRRAAAIEWAVGWLAVAWATFLSYSRAGVGILFVGTALYLINEARHAARRSRAQPGSREAKWRRTAMAVTAVLILLSAFLLFGGATLQRFRPGSMSAPVKAITNEFRLRIQGDAIDMVRASPWCGAGLANFAGVFPVYRQRSVLPMRTIHPESDYLWLATELGWPALALALIGGVIVARRFRPFANVPDRRVRAAATIGLAAFVLHGLVDVSAHRLGTALAAIFLLAMALPADKSLPTVRWPVFVFRGLGLVFIAVGSLWVFNALGEGPPLPGRQGVDRLIELAKQQGASRDYAGVLASIDQALTWAPLDWSLHFARGAANIHLRDNPETALADFRRARYLDPFMADLPYTEAKLWLAAGQNDLAVNALAEACRREPIHAPGLIGDIFQAAAPNNMAFHDALSAMTGNDPALEAAFLEQTTPPESVGCIAERVAADPDLRRLDDAQKVRFFQLWAQRGDVSTLIEQMNLRPDWQKIGWRWWAEACARSGNPQEACEIARRFAPRPVLPAIPAATLPAQELAVAVTRSLDDPFLTFQLYRVRSQLGSLSAPLAAVRRITAKSDCPRYFHYLDAGISGEAGDWLHAWEAWGKYLYSPLP
jgi:O-antigen ligase